jgi:hypothetical protein
VSPIVAACAAPVDAARHSATAVTVFFILAFIVSVPKKWLNKCKFNVNIADCVLIISNLNKPMVA